MVGRFLSLALFFASFLLVVSATADDSATAPDTNGVVKENLEKPLQDWGARHAAAKLDYEARMSEFLNARAPANVVIQSNTDLLYAELMIGSASAAVDYDRRASRIESVAKTNLDFGTGTKQELAQATDARLNALLKDFLNRNSD